MKITRVSATIAGITSGGIAGTLLEFNAASAATATIAQPTVAVASSRIATPAASPVCPPMSLAIAFTSNVTDTSALDLRLPQGPPGDPEGQIIEDYGAYNGTSIRDPHQFLGNVYAHAASCK